MHIKKLLEIIDGTLPAIAAVEGDRIGLQIHTGKEDARIVLVTYELNEDVIAEAVKLKCDCIISFHPLIYSPLLEINNSDRVGRLSVEIIRNSISLIIIHSNFDTYSEGTSAIFAKKLGLKVQDVLVPNEHLDKYGMGVIATPEEPLQPMQLVELVSEVCGSPARFCYGSGKPIEKIAIVGGSGSSYLQNALDSCCDVFITADISYHKFHQVDSSMMLIDPGHYEMEQFVSSKLASLIKELDVNSEIESVYVSGIHTNPVRYYPGTSDYLETQMNYLINNNNTV
jgi:dinuclear metal center YbgI/SA1388 family protein